MSYLDPSKSSFYETSLMNEECKICPICQEPSEQPHQVHYGGLACFSCRAFFRRAHQKTRNPNFSCKKGNNCAITVKTRRRCQKCRYELCLQNGMKPEAVLTDDQKKVRFRNALRKKASRKTDSAISREFIDDDDDDEDGEDNGCTDDRHKYSTQNGDSGLDSADADSRPPDSPISKKARVEYKKETSESYSGGEEEMIDESSNGPYSFSMANTGAPGCPIAIRQVEKVLSSFNLTCGQMVANEGFKLELLSFHRGDGWLSKKSFLSYVTALGNQYRHFALMHKEFRTLPKSDQRKLLARNTPLFIQFVVSRYITGENGLDQIQWLMGPHAPEVSSEEQVSLRKVSIRTLNQSLRMFKSSHLLDTYNEFAKRLNFKTLRYKCLSVLGHLILFQHDNTMVLEAPDLVNLFCEDALTMCPHSAIYFGCIDKPNIPGMIFTLEAMARLFAQNFLWTSEVARSNDSDFETDSPCTSSNPGSPSSGEILSWTPRYSADEEKWLNDRLSKLDEVSTAVRFSEDIINEYIMYSLIDVPLSKHFMPRSMRMLNERYRWVMKMHPEFRNLTGKQQMKLWERNSLYGVALNVAKLESCETGTQQTMFILGKFDKEMVNQARTTIGGKEPKKLTMGATNRYTGILTESHMANFDRLVKSIESVIKDDTTFKLLVLTLLFSDIDAEEMPEMERLQKTYLNIVRRRTRDLVSSGGENENNLALGNIMYSKFNSCVCDVKELAMIVEKLENIHLKIC